MALRKEPHESVIVVRRVVRYNMFCIAVVDSFGHWGHSRMDFVVCRDFLMGRRDSGNVKREMDWRVDRVKAISFRQEHFPGGMEELREDEGVGNAGKEAAWNGVWSPILPPFPWFKLSSKTASLVS